MRWCQRTICRNQFFPPVGSGNWTQAVCLGNKHFSPVSHLAGLCVWYFQMMAWRAAPEMSGLHWPSLLRLCDVRWLPLSLLSSPAAQSVSCALAQAFPRLLHFPTSQFVCFPLIMSIAFKILPLWDNILTFYTSVVRICDRCPKVFALHPSLSLLGVSSHPLLLPQHRRALRLGMAHCWEF